jgi:putative component of toxin-antitoxin plasmid stabilization module
LPPVTLVFFRELDGRVPVREWLLRLQLEDYQAHDKLVARLRRLASLGFDLRRPEADYVRDGLYELRAKRGHVNLRILYSFHGGKVVVLLHALTKEDRLPEPDLRRALDRMGRFVQNPVQHTHEDPP